MTNGSELLSAILRQAIKDYVRLNPDSSLVSAEFHESEGKDFKTAEDFIFNNIPIQFGELDLNFDKVCRYLRINQDTIKRKLLES